MKLMQWACASVMLLAQPFTSLAQCASPLEQTVLDTLVTSSGNAHHNFTFPRFNASLGNLIDVKIQTETSLRYTFQLENRENIAINNYRVRVTREDEISGAVLPIPFNSNFQKTYGPYDLAADDGVPGSGFDHIQQGPMYVMDHHVTEHHATNTANFLGVGSVTITYDAVTYSVVFGSVNYNFNGTAEDSVRFKIVYRYCLASALASDLLSFTAVRSGNAVDVRWLVDGEKTNRRYVVEKSSDGRNFVAAADVTAKASGNYQHMYVPSNNESGKMVFRLKQVEADGKVKYSAVRVVDIGGKTDVLRVYPNPSNGLFNIVFHNTKRGDYKVEVLNATGQIIKEFAFNKALTARIDIGGLSKGLYYLRTINKKNLEQVLQPVVLR